MSFSTTLVTLVLVLGAGQGPPEETSGSKAAFDLSDERSGNLLLPAGTPLYAEPSLRADELLRVQADVEVEVLERRGGWAQVRFQSWRGWLRGPGKVTTVPLAPLPVDAKGRDTVRGFLDGERRLRLGPYPLYTDVTDDVLLARLSSLADQVGAAFARRYGVTAHPDGEEAAILFAAEESFRAYLSREHPGVGDVYGYTGEGFTVLYVGERPPELLEMLVVQQMTYLMTPRALGRKLPDWLEEGLALDLAYGHVDRKGRFHAEKLRKKHVGTFHFTAQAVLVETREGLAPRAALCYVLTRWEEPERPGLSELLDTTYMTDVEDEQQRFYRSLFGFWVRYLIDGDDAVYRQTFQGYLAGVAAGGLSDTGTLLAGLGAAPEDLEAGFEAWLWETARKLRIEFPWHKRARLPQRPPYAGLRPG